MTRLTIDHILPNDEFLAQRQKMMSEVLQAKRVREAALGDAMSFLFENFTTMRWQVQEMCRVEGITKPTGVRHEVDTYSALVSTPDTLKATLLIQFEEPALRDRRLRELVGVHEHLRLEVDGCAPVAVGFDTEQFNADRVSSVQFVEISLTEAHKAALADRSKAARLVCDHPAYPATTELSHPLRAALLDDLAAS